MPETPAGVEAPRPGSPGLGLKFVGALLEAARCRLGDVIQQAEILQEALQELQRNRLASMPGGCKGPESSAVGQEYNVDGSADEGTEAQRRGVTGRRPGSLPERLLGPRALGSRSENPQPCVFPQHPPAWPGQAHSQRDHWGGAEEGPTCPSKQASGGPRLQPGEIHGRAGPSPVLSLSSPETPGREPSDRDCDDQKVGPSEHQGGKRPQRPPSPVHT
ncbi:uncharacterized protein LOC110215297 isoform X1 [Phascolarctos cinereus]|uniref:Uncharacterized protein LOC110215297 n=1 Tax=Phascolarctos cinereus TaxID=38626 RepID=A0A6P5L9Q8_PHACI|nr:uncharacterized protein LOC110215297 [Phascolarctos cinereus]XP_020852322.1 uncharacterized protein LOC110215297 [Phascolarctos cinereus]XP_020852323.1 uncharacterized protein LOC110215297 [Phascolarctos cinereus]XP_020852324.1 uncharacterized protein LOC110215297 [Phascolarctos cinereus]XP_020852325.1 uncharacterized protein LOC110215297 [Phascolarctos cinereus]